MIPTIAGRRESRDEDRIISSDDLAVIEAAHWAVNHLRALEPSGTLEPLRLMRVARAGVPAGAGGAATTRPHDALLLTLELRAPPGLLAGAREELTVEATVLTDRRDGVRSLALDPLPARRHPAA